MRSRVVTSFAGVLCALATDSAALAGVPRAGAATVRRVFVNAVDANGAAVTDLTVADLAVKEGGKEREVVKVEPAATRMRLSLLVDERLVGDSSTRSGIFEFVKRLQASADVALIVVGLRNTVVADHTAGLNGVLAAINNLTMNPGSVSNVAEGILEESKRIARQKPERPVIVSVTLAAGAGGGEIGGGTVIEVLGQLRQSGATLSAIALGRADSGSEQVLSDGTKQSGGRRIDGNVTSVVPRALLQIAGDLTSQYMVTYTLPDGVKPDKRLSVSVKRSGVTLRAPAAVPDK